VSNLLSENSLTYEKAKHVNHFFGGPERTRTSDLRFRKPLLYPAELRDQEENVASRHRSRTLSFAAPAFVYEIPPQLQGRTTSPRFAGGLHESRSRPCGRVPPREPRVLGVRITREQLPLPRVRTARTADRVPATRRSRPQNRLRATRHGRVRSTCAGAGTSRDCRGC
jgi:hypothetical protein